MSHSRTSSPTPRAIVGSSSARVASNPDPSSTTDPDEYYDGNGASTLRPPIPISDITRPIIQLATLDLVGRKPTKELNEEELAQKITALSLGTQLFKRKNIIHILPLTHIQERTVFKKEMTALKKFLTEFHEVKDSTGISVGYMPRIELHKAVQHLLANRLADSVLSIVEHGRCCPPLPIWSYKGYQPEVWTTEALHTLVACSREETEFFLSFLARFHDFTKERDPETINEVMDTVIQESEDIEDLHEPEPAPRSLQVISRSLHRDPLPHHNQSPRYSGPHIHPSRPPEDSA